MECCNVDYPIPPYPLHPNIELQYNFVCDVLNLEFVLACSMFSFLISLSHSNILTMPIFLSLYVMKFFMQDIFNKSLNAHKSSEHFCNNFIMFVKHYAIHNFVKVYHNSEKHVHKQTNYCTNFITTDFCL